jgi:hypothetical protein
MCDGEIRDDEVWDEAAEIDLGQSSCLKENIHGRCHLSIGRICNVGVAVSGTCKVAKEFVWTKVLTESD